MSESLMDETISVEETEDVNEKEEEEEEISAKEILTPDNTSREEEIQNEKQGKLTEVKDTTMEEVPNVIRDIHKSPQKSSSSEDYIKNRNEEISSPIRNSLQGKDDNEKAENLKEFTDASAEKVMQEISASSDAAMDIIKESLNSSVTDENQDISSSVEETLEGKDLSESSTEEVLQERVPPSDITAETIKSPLKSSPTKENPDAADTSSSAQVTSHDKETHSSSGVTTETIKLPLKSSLIEATQNTDSISSAHEPPHEKDLSETTTKETKLSCTKSSSKDQYAVTYSEDGSAIYTDPETKFQYKWCIEANNWKPCDSNSTTTNPYENEHYKWCSKTQKWLPKKTQVTETEHYKWDHEKNEWIPKVKDSTATSSSISEQSVKPSEIIYDIDEDGQRTYTDKDGAVYFWDVDKNAWFPKIDEDFMARYQMSYGFIDNTSESEREKEKREQENKLLKEKELEKLVEEAKANDEAAVNDKQGVKRKGQQEPPKWFDIDPLQNTKVYVSNLPLDITLDEFSDVMGKCGMIMRDPQTQKYKLKLYTEADGQIKGDGLCDYIKRHSEGVAQINMSSPEEADLVIQMMQGRFFGKRQLTAEHWDGKTKYKVEETEEEIQKRLNKWDQYLETDENKKSDLRKDEQDIEKTINFEDSEKSQVSQKVEDTQIVEEVLKEN